MSGIATLTSQFVAAVVDFGLHVLDTRKTAPGLRALDKYAVRALPTARTITETGVNA